MPRSRSASLAATFTTCVVAGSALGDGIAAAPGLAWLACAGPAASSCPADLDLDGSVDSADLAMILASWSTEWGTEKGTPDLDGSGVVDAADLGLLLAAWGPCPLRRDCDGDGIDDEVAVLKGMVPDCNGDLVPDGCQDCDGNGVGDLCDIAAGAASDCDGNGVPDSCDPDCDQDGVPDACALELDPGLDCDGDGVLDACQMSIDPAYDCDGDGVLDSCALAAGGAADCNDNGVIDACELDCNGNGIADECELAAGATDCNGDGVLDECEPDCDGDGVPDACAMAADAGLDCNRNGRPDACDIADGTTFDVDGNGAPDECDLVPGQPWDAVALCAPSEDAPAPALLDFSTSPLPADFFHPGSAPFSGVVALAGLPVDAASFGNAPLLLVRGGDPFSPGDRAGGPAVAVAAELSAIRLHSTQPIEVSGDLGATLWHAEVIAHPTQGAGVLTALKTSSTGGTCDLSIPATLHVAFRRQGGDDVRTVEVARLLAATSVPWVHGPDSMLEVADDPASSFTLGVSGPPGGQSVAPIPLGDPSGGMSLCAFAAPQQSIRLDIHNGLEGRSGGQRIDDARKVTVGAATVANRNDTDGDGTTDANDDEVKKPQRNPKGTDEVDLMRLVVNVPAMPAGGEVTLDKLGGADFKLWEKPTKETEVALPATIAVGNLPRTLWIEARSTSTALRDIGLRATYKGATDEVRATGAWASAGVVKVTKATDGVNNEIPGDCEGNAKNVINVFQSTDGRRYGYGTCATNSATMNARDLQIGGRILLEFKTEPKDVEKLGVVWDITRRIESRYKELATGLGTFKDVTRAGKKSFPTQVEVPNDDGGDVDETNTPKNQHIYVFDAPSNSRDQWAAFWVARMNFEEFARVKIGAGFADRDGVREGSRASDLRPWHHIRYLRRGPGSFWLDDDGGTSASEPTRSGTGNGAIKVEPMDGAVTQGFKVVYDKPGKKWTLTGTGSDPVEKAIADVPAGAKWEITLGDRLKVTLTQGNTAFETGDAFEFSVFKSTTGKSVKITDSAKEVTDEF